MGDFKYGRIPELNYPTYVNNGLNSNKDEQSIRSPQTGGMICFDGYKSYNANGQYHRLDGPAIITCSGSKYWYVNGKNITKEVRKLSKKQNLNMNDPKFISLVILKFSDY